ncbi:uncharacterized protein LOC142774423 [Rhipicephalus microplus]|uniref:uncharacterized protein LOC142774423 n=1 Tax=Rhipicephalus microplus TaxID=6941 RepID=UPI003F6BE01A
MAAPQLDSSLMYDNETPVTSGMVKTPPSKHHKASRGQRSSQRTYSKTNIKVRSPLISSNDESSPPSLARRPVRSPRHLKGQPRPNARQPVEVVSPYQPRVASSIDSDESQSYAGLQNSRWWQLLWMLSSTVFITALIPMVVFLTFFTRPGRAFPTSMVIPGVATRVTGASSPFTIPQTSAGLPRVTFDPDEGFLRQPGETIQDFCSKEIELDERPPAPWAPVPTGMSLNTTTKDIQQRPVICVFNAKYWRLQDTYIADFIPVHYCTAILWYGYAVDVKNGSIVWKYPIAKTYKNSLLVMRYNGQLLHRGNNISVYFALGGAREDNANLSLMVGNPGTRRQFVESVWLELNNSFKPWTVRIIVASILALILARVISCCLPRNCCARLWQVRAASLTHEWYESYLPVYLPSYLPESYSPG